MSIFKILFFIACSVQIGFAQNDSLKNSLSTELELQKYPNFKAYLTNVEWLHQAKTYTTILKLTHGERLDRIGRGIQIELYPKINATNYGYLSISASNQVIFPAVTAAAHWMHALGKGFESELGLRYLCTATDHKNISLGIVGLTKYWRHYLFNAKSYLVNGERLTAQTYSFTVRRYARDEASYFRMTVGTSETQENLFYLPSVLHDFRTNAQWISVGWYQRLNAQWSCDVNALVEKFNNSDRPQDLQRQTFNFRINKLF